MWALTGDGQIDDAVLDKRDKQFDVRAAHIRQKRGRSIGWEVPKVSFPRSVDQVGRQWPDEGEDKSTPRQWGHIAAIGSPSSGCISRLAGDRPARRT
jgi:hypothetical protein